MMNIQKLRPVLSRSIMCRPICSTKNVRIAASASIQPPSSSCPISPPNVRQFCSSSVRLSNEGCDDEMPKKIIVEQNFKVPSFGGILAFKGPVNVQVRPTGAMEYPNLDHAFFKLFGSSQCRKSDAKINVRQEGAKLEIEAVTASESLNDSMEATVEIPIVHSVDVVAEKSASIEVSDFMESEFCNLKSDSGVVSAVKVKTKNLNIETESGDVYCHGHIQGNVKINTNSGNVIGDKRFMGSSLDINTNTGDIRVASCYSDHSKFSTNRGSMNLRNLHNESYVAVYEQGDVKIHGIDGATNVFVKKGDLDIQISNVRAESRLHVEEGDIHLRLSDAHPLKISVEANDVIPDTKFQAHGKLEKAKQKNVVHYFAALQPDEFSPTLVVIAENGNVILESQDWAASLGFKLMSKKDMKRDMKNAVKLDMQTSPKRS